MGHATASGRTTGATAPLTPVSTDGKIYNDRTYRVQKFSMSGSGDADYGTMNGSDVKLVIRGATYDPDLGMWFTRSGNTGYSVTEVDRRR